MPESLSKIGVDAFAYCESLNEIKLPKGLKSIDNFAFWYCIGLESIIIPETVEIMGEKVFGKCSSLKEIWFMGKTPPTAGRSVLGDIPQDAVIYVPTESLVEYRGNTGWREYADKIVGY